MKRRNFFKAFAALAATVVVAPSVLAKITPDKSIFTNGSEIDWSEGVDFDDYLNAVTKNHPGENVMYCGDEFYETLKKWAGNRQGTVEAKTEFGVTIDHIRTHWGSYPVIHSSFFDKELVYFSPFPKDSLALIEWRRKNIKPRRLK